MADSLQDLTAAGVSIWLDEIPATQAGLPAIPQCLADGISINVTLIFSLQRYAAVIEAFFDGMEPALAAGRNLSTLTFVGSFFVSRVDTEIDKRLDQMATTKARAPKGKAATANSRLAYKHYERVFAGERRGALLAAGAQPQQPLRASAGVKDLSYDDTRYVVDLVTRALSTRCRRRPWGRTQHHLRPPPEPWYADHAVGLAFGTAVTSLDPAAWTVTTASGEQLRYDKLLLTTGSTPRRLWCPR